MKENSFNPFIHNVSVNVWQVCYLNDNNYLCARTFKGRHAKQFAKEFLIELIMLNEVKNENT